MRRGQRGATGITGSRNHGKASGQQGNDNMLQPNPHGHQSRRFSSSSAASAAAAAACAAAVKCVAAAGQCAGAHVHLCSYPFNYSVTLLLLQLPGTCYNFSAFPILWKGNFNLCSPVTNVTNHKPEWKFMILALKRKAWCFIFL